MKHNRLIIAVLLNLTVGLAATTTRSAHPYRKEYKENTFGRKAIPHVAAGAVGGEIVNSHKWGRGASGFGKRAGSSFAFNAVKNSIEYPIAAARHEDLHYQRSDKAGFLPRLKHALVSVVVTRKTTTGKKTVASGRLAGSMGAGMVASTWAPAGFSVAGGAASGGISLGAAAGVNVAREFWPRHHPKQEARKHTSGRRG